MDRDELAATLRNNLETFSDVSVISFGWVALFILIYIVIVGPLDYLFLKKVVKRLELTWITFPAVVLVVSAAAYFTAYALKGNDLKINKLDLIDVDGTTGQVYGQTWFTLFSPRIQLYTVGVEPASPDWTPEPKDGNRAASVVVSWLGKPDTTYGGTNRPSSQSLFRRTYEYDTDAAGLTGVPIQVWSTKSFTASWERPFASSKSRSTLKRRTKEDGPGIVGEVHNPLPVNLNDAVLIYAEGPNENNVKAFALGAIAAGQTKRLIAKPDSPILTHWLTAASAERGTGFSSDQQFIKQLMFHGAFSAMDQKRDSVLTHLDQSWRRFHPNEAILVGRIARQEGPAESISQNAATPSRLWLGQLPSAADKRPALAGTMVQDTYVRVFLPVALPPSGAPK